MKKVTLNTHLANLPTELADSLEGQYKAMMEHYMLGEWADLQVDAGRFSEAVLRLLEWYVSNTYTPIDGKSKPDRKRTVNAARQKASLENSLRTQIPDLTEVMMDFRNNRNSAHLGKINPAKLDGGLLVYIAGWILGEILRIDSNLDDKEIQGLLDGLANRPLSVIYEIEGYPVVLLSKLSHSDTVLLLLYSQGASSLRDLYKWSTHTHITRWRTQVISPLQKQKMILVKDEKVHLLPPGTIAAEKILKAYSR